MRGKGGVYLYQWPHGSVNQYFADTKAEACYYFRYQDSNLATGSDAVMAGLL